MVEDVFVDSRGEEEVHVLAAGDGVADEGAGDVHLRGVDHFHAVHVAVLHRVARTGIYEHAELRENRLPLAPLLEGLPVVASDNDLELMLREALAERPERVDGEGGPRHRELEDADVYALRHVATGQREHGQPLRVGQEVARLLQRVAGGEGEPHLVHIAPLREVGGQHHVADVYRVERPSEYSYKHIRDL